MSGEEQKSTAMAIQVSEAKPLTQQQENEIDTYLGNLGCTLKEGQMQQFKTLCREFGLNPFKREIYGIPYNDKFNIIVGYEVYIKRANRTGLLDGMERGTTGSGSTMKAWIKIYRKDWSRPFHHEVDYDEYVQMKWDYDKQAYTVNAMWKSKPKTMLLKVATAQAFRLCFPEDFAGMPYTSDELPLDGAKVYNEVKVDSNVQLSSGETMNKSTGEIVGETNVDLETKNPGKEPVKPDNAPIKRAPQGPGESTEGKPSSSDAMKMNLWSMLEQMYGSNASSELEKLTTFKGRDGMVPGKKDISRVSVKQVGFLTKKVKKDFEDWKKLGGNAEPKQGQPGIDAPEAFAEGLELSDGQPQGQSDEEPPLPDEPPNH